MDHGRLKMEAAVSQVEDKIRLISREAWRSAAENLALAKWGNLWNQHPEAGTLKYGLHGVKGSIELDSPYHGNGFSRLKVPL